MNRLHRLYCRSGLWRRTVHQRLLPWALAQVPLGDDVLEVGPGPGVTTELLCRRAPRVTAVEIDPELAGSLRARLGPEGVRVVEGDATELPFPDDSFSAVLSFTMLHHVPSAALQDRLLAQAFRVLRPGGVFAGTDSLPSLLFRLAHLRDTMVLVDPEGLAPRLAAAGFADVRVHVARGTFRFRARKPEAAAQAA